MEALEPGGSPFAKGVWDWRWARFAVALAENGVEPKMQAYCKSWVLGFLKFVRPKKYFEVTAEEVEGYLRKLRGDGKQNWQIKQAADSLRVFYQCVELVRWATPWPERLEGMADETGAKEWLDSSHAGEVSRPPTQGRQSERSRDADVGELPERMRGFYHEVEERLRAEHYSYRTEQTYLDWVKRFLVFANPRRRAELVWDQAKEYLDYLVLVRRVSGSTQNQALSALQFLYGVVLGVKAVDLEGIKRAAQSQRVPTVLGREEVNLLFEEMEGRGKLLAQVLYGAGLRVSEGVRLRV